MATTPGVAAPAADAPTAKRSRAGRNLPAAIAVGVSLGGALILTLYLYRPAFVVFVAIAIGGATRELVRALHLRGLRPPLIPLVAGSMVSTVIGYPEGTWAALIALGSTLVVATGWRLLLPPADVGSTGQDMLAIAFTTLYIGFGAAFAVLLVVPSDGPRRVTAAIVTAVCSDVGGYAAGVLSGGRHKLAPTISPGKSVEGSLGGTAVCIVSGLIFLGPVLHGGHWWYGVVFGLAIVVASTLGDLAESALKRDIGIKDMGTLLPGHGGILDRIDSLLLAVPVSWLLLTAMVDVH